MRKKNSTTDILKTIGQGFWSLIKGLVRLFLKIVVTFGLWLPGLYAVLGTILYYGLHFDPFDFSLYSVVYLSGGFACIICAIIISVRNLVVNPVRNAFSRKRKKVVEDVADDEFIVDKQTKERRDREREERLYPAVAQEPERKVPSFLPETEEESEGEDGEEQGETSLLFDWLPQIRAEEEAEPEVKSVPKKEVPAVYFSKLDPDVLVHEYADRFELYRVKDDAPSEYIGVEYK